MAFDPNAPAWLMDLNGGGATGDPLLDALEEERRRRRAFEQAAPAPTPTPVVDQPTVLQPLSEGPGQFVGPATTPTTYEQDRQLREALEAEDEARLQQARIADQEAAGVTPDGKLHPSRQDTDGGLAQPGETKPTVSTWDTLVHAASQAFAVPVNVIKAIIDIESGGDPSATSGAGAQGLMQVMPFHRQGNDDLYDPATNIMYGTRILAENFARSGSWEHAAAAYFGAYDWSTGQITGASDGNATGYHYVDAFTQKAQAYADQWTQQAPTYGPSIPVSDARQLGDLRPSQLPEANPQLSMDAAYAACGPAAAIVFAAMTGRAPTLEEAVAMGRSIKAWDEGVGMYGIDAEVRLIQALGGSARVAPGLDPQTIINEVTNGNPVLVNSPATPNSAGHYGVISGFDPASGRFYFGTSATDLKGGSAWMTLEEYQQLGATGPITGMLLVDNPIAPGPSAARVQAGPSLPRNYDPTNTFRNPVEVDQEAAQKELEAAQELARQVTEQVRRSQERTRKESEQQEMLRQPLVSSPADLTPEDGGDAASPLDLLRPVTDAASAVGQGIVDAGRGAAEAVNGGLRSAVQAGMEYLAGAPIASFESPEAAYGAIGRGFERETGIDPLDPWDWLGAGYDFGTTMAAPGVKLAEAANRYVVNQISQNLGFETQRPASLESERGELQSTTDPTMSTSESLVNTQKRAWVGVGSALSMAAADIARQNGYDPLANELEEVAKLGKSYLYDNPEVMRRATKDVFDSPYGLVEGIAESAPSILPTALGVILGIAGARTRNPGLVTAGGRLAQAGLALAGAQAYGGTLEELRPAVEQGRLSESAARAAATGAALIETTLEKVLPGIEKRLITDMAVEAGKKTAVEMTRRGIALAAVRTVGGEVLQEGVEESVAEAYGVGLDLAFKDKAPTLAEAVRRIGNAAVIGAASGGLMASPMAASDALTADAQRRQQTLDREATARIDRRADEIAQGLAARGVAEAGGSPADGLGVVQQMDYGSPADGLGGSPADGLTTYSSTTDRFTTDSTPLPPTARGEDAPPLSEDGAPVAPSLAGLGTTSPSPPTPSPRRALAGVVGSVAERAVPDDASAVASFAEAAERGVIHQAPDGPPTWDLPEGVTELRTPISRGLASGYSADDIKAFYLRRRWDPAWDTTPDLAPPTYTRHDALAVALEEFERDLTREPAVVRSLLGAQAEQTAPRRTVRVGPFEVPGQELGTYETIPEGEGTWTDIEEFTDQPTAADPSVVMAGRKSTPPELMLKVANRGYLSGIIGAAKATFGGTDGQHRPAMAVLQSVADRVLGGKPPAKADVTLGWIAAGAQDQYGWSQHNLDIAINPAEFFHYAVAAVAEEEQANGQPYSPADQRQRILELMAEKQVEVVLHEAAHYWGPDGGSREDQHGGDFKALWDPIKKILINVNAGTLSAAQMARIEKAHGLEAGTVRILAREIDAMVKATVSTFSQTFATVEGQVDELALLNDDAKEQRLLVLTPRRQRGTTTERQAPDGGDRGPDDVDVGAGPAVPPADGPGDLRGPEPGASRDGVQRGAEDAPVGPEPDRAAGVGSAESAPAEPAADGAEQQPAPELTDPRPSSALLRTIKRALDETVRKHGTRIPQQAQAPVVVRFATKLAAELRARFGEEIDRLDPRVFRWSLDYQPSQAQDTLARATFWALYGNTTDVSPSPPLEYLTQVVERGIDLEPDPEQTWNPGEIQLVLGTRDPKLAVAVMAMLQARGVLDSRGREVPQADRGKPPAPEPEPAPAEETPAEPDAPAPENTETEGGGPQSQESPSRPPQSRQRAKSTPTPKPTPEAARRTQLVEDLLANVEDDGWVLGIAAQNNGRGAQREGRRLAVAAVVDHDRHQTAANRRAVLEALDQRRYDLYLESKETTDPARQEQIKRVRSALLSIKKGFGFGADYEIESRVTEELPDRRGKLVNVPIAQFRVSRAGETDAIVRGIGRMQVAQGVTEGTRRALDVLAKNVARIPRTRFADADGNLIGMSQALARGMEIFYEGRTDVPTEEFLGDMEQVARAFLAQNPDLDTNQPQMLGLLMQAFQLQVAEAFAKVEEARQADHAEGTANKQVKDPVTGELLGRGPKTVEALRAMDELMQLGSLLPSIKKLATTSGRNLRAMQMAEERLESQSRLRVLQGLEKSTQGLIDLLKKVEAEIAAGRNVDELLRGFRLLDGSPISEERIRAEIKSRPVADLLVGIAAQNQERGVGVLGLFSQYAGLADSAEGLRSLLLGDDERSPGLLTIPQLKKLDAMIAAERAHREAGHTERLYDQDTLDEITLGVIAGLSQYQRRLKDRAADPDDPQGRPLQVVAKERYRAEGENWGQELVTARLRDLTAREIDVLYQRLQAGLAPDMDDWWQAPARPGASYSRQDLRKDLLRKRAEILAWKQANDPQSLPFKQNQRRLGAAVGGPKKPENLQLLLGRAYRQEMLLDREIGFVKGWAADARSGRVADDPAEVEALLAGLESERETVLLEMMDLELDITIDLFSDLSEKLDKRDIVRTEAEAKLSDADVESLLALHLGAEAQQKLDRELLLEAMANREIGRIEKQVRTLLKEHYHQAFDERTEIEYWVGFVERAYREHGTSEDPAVQQQLAEIKARADRAIADLKLHPQYGELLARGLESRIMRAVHGDAGALVAGIRSALTGPGYLLDDERHPDYEDIQAIRDNDKLEALAGTVDAPGPLALTLADPSDEAAYLDLVETLDIIEQEAPLGLGAAFKAAVFSAVDISHRRARVLELLPLVEANPTDAGVRYLVEAQLHDLKRVLGDHETDPWFRRRFGSAEVALRRQYERAVDKGAARLEREAERRAEAANTYDALLNAGVATQADFERAQDGRPTKKTASEIILERLDRQKADALAKQIRAVTTAYWAEPDAARRDQLEAEQQDLLEQLDNVGYVWDPKTGEKQGIGPRLARQLAGQIMEREFKEQEKQGVRQQGWDQRDEIKLYEREIRLVHRHLLLLDPASPEAQALQQELQTLLGDLDAVGATEREDSLKMMGHEAAERLVEQLDLRTIRFVERETERRARRAAVEEVRDLRQAAMTFVRDLARDPQDAVARDALYTVLDEMAQIAYSETREVTIEDRDPTNGGLIGTRKERQDVVVWYGREQAQQLADMVDVRTGSSVADLDALAGAASTRPEETNVIAAVRDRLKVLTEAGRTTDDLGRLGGHVTGLIETLERLGERGRQAAEQERARLRSVGFTRAMLRGDADTRDQTVKFFQMLAPVPNPTTGALEYNPRSVARALKLVTAPNWADYYREYGVIGMLGSPTTWGPLGVNTVGQILNVAIQPTRWVYKLGSSQILKAFGAEQTVYGSEAGAALGALNWALLKRAGKSAFEIWWYGHSAEQLRRADESGDLAGLRGEYLVDRTEGHMLLNGLARLGHMSSLRILKATDEFIGTLVYEAAYRGQLERAAKQHGKTPAQVENDIYLLADVVEKTGKVRQGVLFQERDKILGFINNIARPSTRVGKEHADHPGVQALDMVLATYVPFTTVPYNAVKQSMQLSGLGGLVYAGMTVDAAIKASGGEAGSRERLAARRGLTSADLAVIDADGTMVRRERLAESEQVADYLSKALLGATVQAVGMLLAGAGLLTGDEPDEPEERAIDQEHKLPPRSIKLGDRWYSYDSTPFAVPFAIAANIDQNWKKHWANIKKETGVDSPLAAKGAAAFQGTVSAAFHNFFLENLLEAASGILGIGAPRSTESTVYGLASPLVTRHVPALLAYYARQGDAFERDTRSDSGVPGRLGNLFLSRVPGLRDDLPAKVGILGQPTENRQPKGAGLTSYSRSEQARFDQLLPVLRQYGITNLTAPETLAAPQMKNSTFAITLDEQRLWQQTFGEHLFPEVARTYNGPTFKQIYNVPRSQDRATALELRQTEQLQAAVERARTKAAQRVVESLGPDQRARYEVINERIRTQREKQTTTPADAPAS